MKDYMKIYEEWLSSPYFDEDTKAELRAIAGNEDEIRERFYMDLEFGTAGLRGIIGAGINRMNIYVVRRATQGSFSHKTIAPSRQQSATCIQCKELKTSVNAMLFDTLWQKRAHSAFFRSFDHS